MLPSKRSFRVWHSATFDLRDNIADCCLHSPSPSQADLTGPRLRGGVGEGEWPLRRSIVITSTNHTAIKIRRVHTPNAALGDMHGMAIRRIKHGPLIFSTGPVDVPSTTEFEATGEHNAGGPTR